MLIPQQYQQMALNLIGHQGNNIMDKIDYSKSFIIKCESFEDRKDIYETLLFNSGRRIYADDYTDYKSLSDYAHYPHIKWSVGEDYFIASAMMSSSCVNIISSFDFRKLNGFNLKEHKKQGCGSKLIFKFV